MAVSVFHPDVVDGWRDPDPPVSTPGVVWASERRVPALSSTTNLAPDVRHRIAPHYIDGVADAYVRTLTVASSGDVTLRIESRTGTPVNLTAAARAALTLVARVGTDELVIPLSTLPGTATASPYTWNNVDADDWALAVATSDGAVVQCALVDGTTGNINGAEVFDPEPRYVPFAPVVEPISMFDEAAEGVDGLVWRHTRRSLIASAAPVAIVDASRPDVLARAFRPIRGQYVGGGDTAYVTRLDFAAGEVRLFVQSTPISAVQGSTARTLNLAGLALAIRPRGLGNVRWSVELGDFQPEAEDVPGLYVFRTAVPLLVRNAMPLGAAVAVLVDTRSPNVDLVNYQFRRLAGVEDDYTIELLSASVGVRTRARLSHRRAADTDIDVALTAEEEVTTRAVITRTPFTGEPPRVLPTVLEVREVPTFGAYRSRRWIDHSDDFAALSWTRAIGSIGTARGEITTRDQPEGVFATGAPEYIGRAISQRFLDSGDVALTFRREDAASHMRVGDAALIDGVTVSPPTAGAEFEVLSRESRGAQRVSLFDAGDVGADSVSGIRIRASALALGGTVQLGGVSLLDITVASATLTPTGIVLSVTGTIPEIQDVVDRHAVFARAGGESWGVSMVAATVNEAAIFVTIPESERGTLTDITQEGTYDLTVVVVETADANERANPRLNIGRREIVFLAGDSLFTAVEPAAPGADDFAGLIARTETSVTATALPITLSDLSQRFEVGRGRFVAGIRLVAGGRMEVDTEDRFGRAQPLSADDVERLVIIARVATVARRFRLSDGTYAGGTYTIGGAEGLRDEILFVLNFAPGAAANVTTLIVDAGYYTLDDANTALAGTDGDYFEIAFRAGLVPRSREVRYQVTLPDVRAALSVFDVAAATALRGQYLAADPVGDGTVESVSGVLLIQNDTVGFANLSDGTSYIHRLLIAHSPQATGPNAGRHQIAIIFSEVAGAVSPATPPDDAALDGLVLAFRFRRGTEEAIIQYTVDTSDAVRDAAGEQAIIDHVDLPSGYDNASAPDDFDLAIVDPGRGYDRDTQTLPGTAIPYPRVSYGADRFIRPWTPPDGAEFRVLLNLWTPQISAITTPAPNRVRLAVPGATQLTARQAATIPGHPVVAWREFRGGDGIQDLTENAGDFVARDTDAVAGTFTAGVWRFRTPNGSDVAIQEISLGPGGTSIAFELGGGFNALDLANLAIVIQFGTGSSAAYTNGLLLSDFSAQNPIQLAAPAPSWRSQAMAAFTARNRCRIVFVDITVPGVNQSDWSFGHDHTGSLPPLSAADKIIITDGIALLDGSDPRTTPLQIITVNPGPASRWIEADAPGGLVALGARATWQRAIDRRPVFGGWWINPRQQFTRGGPGKQKITVTAQDYSAVLDRRLHGGGRIQSRDGETVGEFMARLIEQWQNDLPYASDEGLGVEIDPTLGGVIEPAFNTEDSGGTRSSWRTVLQAVTERAQGLGGYHVDAGKRLVWRRHGAYTGLTLTAGADYQALEIREDRNRARNVVDVRAEPESTILVTEEDPANIADRARVEGGTGRYEIVSDSPEGNAAGEEIARQHGRDSLARYPFVYRCTVGTFTDDRLPYLQVIRLFELRPGDAFRLTGPHLPDLPAVRTTIIATGVLYVEPASGGALPASVVPGTLLQIDGVVLEVVGGGGPRGAVWCTVPDGVTVSPATSTAATLIERWLCEGVKVDVVRSRSGFVLKWSITGMRPRVGADVGRSQTGYVGQWIEAIRGAAR